MAVQCQVGSLTDNQCENEATVAITCEPVWCEQHYKNHQLICHIEEWQIARDHLQGFSQIAKASGTGPLMDCMDLAWAECQMRISVLEAQLRMVWE